MIERSTLRDGSLTIGNSKACRIRIEIGPRDVKHEQVTIARRDTYEKYGVKKRKLLTLLKASRRIQNNLFNKAKKFLEEHITTVKSYEEFKKS
jgi:prolyl-tRNA synthetase